MPRESFWSARAAATRWPRTPSRRDGVLHDTPDVRLVVFRLAPGQHVPLHRNESTRTALGARGRRRSFRRGGRHAARRAMHRRRRHRLRARRAARACAPVGGAVLLATITPRPAGAADGLVRAGIPQGEPGLARRSASRRARDGRAARRGRSIAPSHMHMVLLGFVTMMIYGVAYHVIPRFTGHALSAAARRGGTGGRRTRARAHGGRLRRSRHARALGTPLLASGGILSASARTRSSSSCGARSTAARRSATPSVGSRPRAGPLPITESAPRA